MQHLISPTAEALAQSAAERVAEIARQSVALRGIFTWAVSGGRTPWAMLARLTTLDMPWPAVRIYQVDERSAPDGHADRNLTHLEECLLGKCPLERRQIAAMPVTMSDLDQAARDYAVRLGSDFSGLASFDLIHLGLGPDGHTASLVPGDPILQVVDLEVAATGVYQGRRRLSLTYPVLNRARQIVWLAEGESKVEMVRRMLAHDASIPAGRVEHERAVVMTDRAAAGG